MTFLRSGFPGKSVTRLARRLSPIAGRIVRYVSSEMEYAPHGWPAGKAWNDESIADAQEAHWPTFVRNLQGPGPLGVSHLPWHVTREDLTDHNIMMSYGYVLATAARKKDRISILDWGGGIGHYYLYSRTLVPDVEIDYDCFDLPNLCRLGKKLMPEVRTHVDESDFAGRQYDLVVSSSSLHYFEDWRAEVRKLAGCTHTFLYVARLQTVSDAASFVVLHTPSRDGYPALPGWCINRREFLACAEACGLVLVREFIHTDPWTIRGAPEKGQCRGFLLRRGAGPG
jgi:putative methyltransferase (TIGR04325 family)